MKKTRKWSFVQQEAVRLAELRLSPKEIADRLGVNKSSVTRWMKAGKLKATAQDPRATAEAVAKVLLGNQTPAQWAAEVRTAFALDVTDDQMVSMAESVLLLIRDPLADSKLRLQAMGRFQALVKQLNLLARVADAKGEDERPTQRRANPPVQRSSADPRGMLRAV